MALYGYIEQLEKIMRRDVPKNESQLAVVAYIKGVEEDPEKDVVYFVGLRRGNFPGDVWWDTPDGESVFNRWRIAIGGPGRPNPRGRFRSDDVKKHDRSLVGQNEEFLSILVVSGGWRRAVEKFAFVPVHFERDGEQWHTKVGVHQIAV